MNAHQTRSAVDSDPGMNPNTEVNVDDVRYFKLPYIGKFSSIARMKVQRLISRCCTETIDAKFIFETYKIGRYFSSKDPVPKCLNNHVVYQFKCAGCNACYIGETARHLTTRVNEHFHTQKDSAIYKHLHDPNNLSCKNASSEHCFTILDRANTDVRLAIKEARYIREQQPDLNKKSKKKQYSLKLLI